MYEIKQLECGQWSRIKRGKNRNVFQIPNKNYAIWLKWMKVALVGYNL